MGVLSPLSEAEVAVFGLDLGTELDEEAIDIGLASVEGVDGTDDLSERRVLRPASQLFVSDRGALYSVEI